MCRAGILTGTHFPRKQHCSSNRTHHSSAGRNCVCEYRAVGRDRILICDFFHRSFRSRFGSFFITFVAFACANIVRVCVTPNNYPVCFIVLHTPIRVGVSIVYVWSSFFSFPARFRNCIRKSTCRRGLHSQEPERSTVVGREKNEAKNNQKPSVRRKSMKI